MKPARGASPAIIRAVDLPRSRDHRPRQVWVQGRRAPSSPIIPGAGRAKKNRAARNPGERRPGPTPVAGISERRRRRRGNGLSPTDVGPAPPETDATADVVGSPLRHVHFLQASAHRQYLVKVNSKYAPRGPSPGVRTGGGAENRAPNGRTSIGVHPRQNRHPAPFIGDFSVTAGADHCPPHPLRCPPPPPPPAPVRPRRN